MPLKIEGLDVPDNMVRSLTTFAGGGVFFDAEALTENDRTILNKHLGNLHKGDVVKLDGYSTDEHAPLNGDFRVDKIDLREIHLPGTTRKSFTALLHFILHSQFASTTMYLKS